MCREDLGFEISVDYKAGTISILDCDGNGPVITEETMATFLSELTTVSIDLLHFWEDDDEKDTN